MPGFYHVNGAFIFEIVWNCNIPGLLKVHFENKTFCYLQKKKKILDFSRNLLTEPINNKSYIKQIYTAFIRVSEVKLMVPRWLQLCYFASGLRLSAE